MSGPIFSRLHKRRQFYLLGALVAVLLVGAGLAIWHQTSMTNSSATTKPVAKKTPNKPGKPLVETADYSVVRILDKLKPVHVEVYTTKTSSGQLVAINDALLAKYKSQYPQLLINYYDDRTVAANYYEQASSTSTSAQDRKSLANHYIAVMFYASTPGQKVQAATFTRLKGTPSTLKKY